MLWCALAAASLWFTHPIPPLSHDDMGKIQYLWMQPVETHGGNNVLILGKTKGWIEMLRADGFKTYGFADHEMWQLYYGEVRSYAHIPWRSAAFKIIACVAEIDRDIVLEIDRLLIPGGYVLIGGRSYRHPDFSHRMFVDYLHYRAYGRLFRDMAVWRKADWPPFERSA